MRDLFTTGPGPDVGRSKPGQYGSVHNPEKYGINRVGCCVNAGDENRVTVTVAVAAMMIDRMMGFSP